MGDHGRALPERQALQRACDRGDAEQLLDALRYMHSLRLAKLDDDLTATAALLRIDDPRASLAAAQFAANVTRALRLDLDGLEDLMTLLDELPESRRRLSDLARAADARLAGP